MPPERAYTPPPLVPLAAAICNLLLTRDWPRGFDCFGAPCSIAVDPWQTPFVPACGLIMDARGKAWQVLFSSLTPMGLHPAGARIADAPDLPEGLRLALFELSLAPVLESLAHVFGLGKPPAILAQTCERPGEFACSVPLALCLPDEDVAVTLYIPERESAEAILRRLAQEKPRRTPVPGLLLAVALEAGSMRLTVPELSALQPGDMLLPEAYPGLAGELRLRLAPDLAIRCATDKARATVLGFEHGLCWPVEQETRREAMADTLPDSAPGEKIQVPDEQQAGPETGFPPQDRIAVGKPASLLDTLEVTVTFELDRRLMSITEVETLVPGYTFTLPADPAGPVAIRVNGKRLGTGRLLEVGGVLGVQLTGMERE